MEGSDPGGRCDDLLSSGSSLALLELKGKPANNAEDIPCLSTSATQPLLAGSRGTGEQADSSVSLEFYRQTIPGRPNSLRPRRKLDEDFAADFCFGVFRLQRAGLFLGC